MKTQYIFTDENGQEYVSSPLQNDSFTYSLLLISFLMITLGIPVLAGYVFNI
jgi:hypothetical protein